MQPRPDSASAEMSLGAADTSVCATARGQGRQEVRGAEVEGRQEEKQVPANWEWGGDA
jgi:hypothetical protein